MMTYERTSSVLLVREQRLSKLTRFISTEIIRLTLTMKTAKIIVACAIVHTRIDKTFVDIVLTNFACVC
jgi:hypothetical protein